MRRSTRLFSSLLAAGTTLALALPLGLVPVASAVGTASISGTVTADGGAVVPGVDVSLYRADRYGYWGKLDKTASIQRDGWYVSGDAVRKTESGELVYLDRVEHLVKLASGHSYPPQFIETRLRFSPFIKDVMVLGDAKKMTEEIVKALAH